MESEIERGQGETLAFCESPPSANREYLGTVVAFANGVGGTIVFGVSPDGEAVGVPERDLRSEISALGEAVSDARLENLRLDVGLSAAYGKTVIVLDIEKGNRKPHSAHLGGRGRAFVRRGSETVEADAGTVERLARGSAFDGGAYVPAMETESRRDDTARPEPDGGIPSKTTPSGPGLAGGTDAGCATTNAEALAGANPFPHAFIRCERYADDASVPVETVDFRGKLVAQVSSATSHILSRIGEGMDRETVSEALGNAVVHRDYSIAEPTVVRMSPDALTVESPGPSVGRRGLLARGRSYPRNPLLQAELMRSGLLSERGSGLVGILGRHPAAAISETLGSFVLKIPVPKQQPERLNKNEQTILAELGEDGTLSAREVSERTGIPYGTVRRLINDMRVNGLITREGSRKTGVWVLSG